MSEMTATIGAPKPRLFTRSFFLVWQGQLVSQIGVQANAIALLLWLKHAGTSASRIGLILMLANLPAVFLEPIGGVLSDRHSKKKILVACDLFSGLAILALALSMFVFPDRAD